MASKTALGWLRQKKHYGKCFTFLAVAGFLYIGYTLLIHFDVVANLRVLSNDNTTWFMPLAEDAALPLERNTSERFLQDDTSSKAVSAAHGVSSAVSAAHGVSPAVSAAHGVSSAVSAAHGVSPAPRGSMSNGFINPTTGTSKWWITLDKQIGRMGNKMFEYASLVGIGWMTGRRPFLQCSPDMQQIFQLTYVENMPNDKSWSLVEETQYAYFDPVFKNLPSGNIKINGYLQSWKYFDRIREHIRKEFALRQNIRIEADTLKYEISQELNKTNPVFVGVHVRQRDEMSTPKAIEAPKSYFINAFSKMRSLLAGYDLVFLVAGNRLDWCRANLNESDVYILPDMSPELHFAVLSSCEHGILSVGTYGWWMAWLTGGQVIFYKKFPTPDSYEYKGFVYRDYYPPNWIPVDD